MTVFGRERRLFSRPVELGTGVVSFQSFTPIVLAVGAAAAILAFIALEWLSFIHEYKGIPSTPWNPGLGVAFAFIMIAGWIGVLALFAGVVIAEIFVLHTQLEWPIIVAIGAIVSLSYGFVAWIGRRNLQLDVALIHLNDVLVLLATGLAGAAIVTVLLTAVLVATGPLGLRDVPYASIPLLVGDIIGIAVMTPLVLRIVRSPWRFDRPPARRARHRKRSLRRHRRRRAMGDRRQRERDGFKFFYVFFVPVVTAACATGSMGHVSARLRLNSAWSAVLHCTATTPALSPNSKSSCSS